MIPYSLDLLCVCFMFEQQWGWKISLKKIYFFCVVDVKVNFHVMCMLFLVSLISIHWKKHHHHLAKYSTSTVSVWTSKWFQFGVCVCVLCTENKEDHECCNHCVCYFASNNDEKKKMKTYYRRFVLLIGNESFIHSFSFVTNLFNKCRMKRERGRERAKKATNSLKIFFIFMFRVFDIIVPQ